MSKITFDSVIFDTEEKNFTILDGSVGTYSYKEIKKCKVLAENAKYRGNSDPFSHADAVGGYSTTPRLIQPNVFVGILIEMKDHTKLALYVSKEETRENTFQFNNDKKEAEKIHALFKKCIQKYGVK